MKEIYSLNWFLNICPNGFQNFKVYKYNLKSYYTINTLYLLFPFYKKNIKKNKNKFYIKYHIKNENI